MCSPMKSRGSQKKSTPKDAREKLLLRVLRTNQRPPVGGRKTTRRRPQSRKPRSRSPPKNLLHQPRRPKKLLPLLVANLTRPTNLPKPSESLRALRAEAKWSTARLKSPPLYPLNPKRSHKLRLLHLLMLQHKLPRPPEDRGEGESLRRWFIIMTRRLQ